VFRIYWLAYLFYNWILISEQLTQIVFVEI